MKVLILSAEKATAKTGSEYQRVRLITEKHEEKSAVYFDNLDFTVEKGKVFDVELKSGSLADKIVSATLLDKEDPKPFYKTTKQDVSKMISDLQAFIDETTDPLKGILQEAMSPQRLQRFSEWPAAVSIHHNYGGGLIEHTWAMLRMAKVIMQVDPSSEGLNKSVIYAAIILHDFGKVLTLNFEAGVSERNNLDILIGHIPLADEMVVRVAKEKKLSSVSGDILNLRHCLLSHHGKKEWGSPVVPSTREAVFVHQLDMIQSRNQSALEAVTPIQVGERAAYNRSLETEFVKL